VAENSALIAKYMKREQVDQLIIPIYTALMNDSEPEVRSEAVNKLADLAEHCTIPMLVQKVLPGLKLQLTTESSQHVKGSMAFAVCKIAEKLKPEDAATHLIPLVSILLKNNSTEVVVSLVENLAPLTSILESAVLQEKLVPTILALANDKTWRIRIAVVQFFPKLAKQMDRESFSQRIEGQLVNMLSDPVFAIREEAGNSVIQLS
jgi:serine/threonine-protein phosphatase 2A regulatory subunit A